MKKTLITLTFLAFIVQMMTHCKNKVETKNETVSKGIRILDKFNKQIKGIKKISSAPLGFATAIQYELDFENFYGGQNIDIKDVEVNFADFWSAFIHSPAEFSTWANNDSQGLNILYTIDSRPGKKYFSYSFILDSMLNCADINNTRNYFIPNFNDHSLVSDHSGSGSVTPGKFNEYFNTVKMRDFENFGTGPTTPINIIQCNAVSAHPRIEFIEKKFLHQFISNNDSALFDANGPKANVRLVFSHGARVVVFHNTNPDCTNPLNRKYRFHVPYLYFTNSNNVPLINEIIYQNAPFKNKALNLGRLCPPECPK